MFERKFGLDKTKLYNIDLIGIDFSKLNKKLGENVVIQTIGETMSVIDLGTNKYKDLAYLKVVDEEMFNCLVIGVKKARGKAIKYVNLDVHINSLRGNNLEPLGMEEYYKLLADVKEYISENYGIELDFGQAKFKETEINLTFMVDRTFQEYEHILILMALLAPKKYKSKIINLDNKNDVTTIILNNKSSDYKIYDKTKQMQVVYKIEITENYIRIEYTIKATTKIERDFNSANIHQLTDKQIREYMQKRIFEDLIKPLEKHIEQGNKVLRKMAKEEREKDIKKWTRLFLLKAVGEKTNDKVPLVFDIEQVKLILKEEGSRNYARTIKRLEEEIRNYKYLNDNFIKLDELKRKIFEEEA